MSTAPDATPAFEFRVFEPEQRKGGALDLPFWVYRIRANIKLQQYPRKEIEVKRRYSDFEWLRAQLGEEYIHCIIPPIPEKNMKGTVEKVVQSAHDPKLLEYRQRALKRFLTRVGAHHELQNSLLLQDFLIMDESEWERRMKTPKKNPAISRSWVDGVAARLAGGGSGSAAPPGAAAAEYTKVLEGKATPPQVWEDTKGYIGQLEQAIGALRNRLTQLVSRRRDTSTALNDFGRNFAKVGEAEAAIERGPLSNAMTAVATHSQSLSKLYLEHADNETRNVIETLSYYVGMCQAVREALQRILAFSAYCESMDRQVEDLKSQKARLTERAAPSEKLAKVEADLTKASEALVNTRKNLAESEKRFKEDLRTFHREKQYDIKCILKSFTDLQLNYAAKMRESWEALRPSVEQLKSA